MQGVQEAAHPGPGLNERRVDPHRRLGVSHVGFGIVRRLLAAGLTQATGGARAGPVWKSHDRSIAGRHPKWWCLLVASTATPTSMNVGAFDLLLMRTNMRF